MKNQKLAQIHILKVPIDNILKTWCFFQPISHSKEIPLPSRLTHSNPFQPLITIVPFAHPYIVSSFAFIATVMSWEIGKQSTCFQLKLIPRAGRHWRSSVSKCHHKTPIKDRVNDEWRTSAHPQLLSCHRNTRSCCSCRMTTSIQSHHHHWLTAIFVNNGRT